MFQHNAEKVYKEISIRKHFATAKIPDNWLLELVHYIAKFLDLDDEDKDDRNKKDLLQKNLFRHAGPNSTYSLINELHDSLKIIYGTFIDATYSSDKKLVMAYKLDEGLPNCTAGFHDRANELVINLSDPENLDELLAMHRQDIVSALAARMTNEVHANNRIFIIASQLGYGIQPLNPRDTYMGYVDHDSVKKNLKTTFQREYTFASVIDTLRDRLTQLLLPDGYNGRCREGYVSGQYTKFEHKLKKFVIGEFTEIFVFDDDDNIIDIDWCRIIPRTLLQNHYFSFLDKSYETLFFSMIDSATVPDKVIMLFESDDEVFHILNFFKEWPAEKKAGVIARYIQILPANNQNTFLNNIEQNQDLFECLKSTGYIQEIYLSRAAQAFNLHKVKQLVLCGADINQVIGTLAKKGPEPFIRFLIDNPSIRDLINSASMDVLGHFLVNSESGHELLIMDERLCGMCYQGDNQKLQAAGQRLLANAVVKNDFATINLLIDRGIDINSVLETLLTANKNATIEWLIDTPKVRSTIHQKCMTQIAPTLVRFHEGRELLYIDQRLYKLCPEMIDGKTLDDWMKPLRQEHAAGDHLPGFYQTNDSETKTFLQLVITGKQREAEAMLKPSLGEERMIRLLSGREKVIDCSGRKIYGTALGIALGAADTGIGSGQEGMVEMLIKYLNQFPNGSQIIAAQIAEQFPHGLADMESLSREDTSAVDRVMQVMQSSNHSEDWENALDDFRKYLEPQCAIRTGKHFNDQLFLYAVELYKKNIDSLGGDGSEKNGIFCRKVIGYFMRYFPACYAHAFCTGLENIKKGAKLKRTLAVSHGYQFYPENPLERSGLGYDYMINSHEKPLVISTLYRKRTKNVNRENSPLSVFLPRLKDLFKVKSDNLKALISKYSQTHHTKQWNEVANQPRQEPPAQDECNPLLLLNELIKRRQDINPMLGSLMATHAQATIEWLIDMPEVRSQINENAMIQIAPALVQSQEGRELLYIDERLLKLCPKVIEGKPLNDWMELTFNEHAAGEIPQGYYQTQDPVVKQFLQHLIRGEQDKVEKMLVETAGQQIHLRLLTGKEKVIAYSGQRLYGTALGLALGAGDTSSSSGQQGMLEIIISYLMKLPDGKEIITRQIADQFPHGLADVDPDCEKYHHAVDQILPVLLSSDNRDDWNSALNTFRSSIAPDYTIRSGRHFNDRLFLYALESYKSNVDQLGGEDSEKSRIFCCKVIGYIMRYFPACYANAFCTGLVNIKKGARLNRSLNVSNGSTFYPDDPFAQRGLGYDYWINSYERSFAAETLYKKRTKGLNRNNAPLSVLFPLVKQLFENKVENLKNFLRKYPQPSKAIDCQDGNMAISRSIEKPFAKKSDSVFRLNERSGHSPTEVTGSSSVRIIHKIASDRPPSELLALQEEKNAEPYPILNINADLFLQHVIDGNQSEVENMLLHSDIEAKIHLLTEEKIVHDLAGRKIGGTALRLALGASDVGCQYGEECMVELLERYMTCLPNGRYLIGEQVRKQFPEGLMAIENKKIEYDRIALERAFHAIEESKSEGDLEQELNRFRNYLAPACQTVWEGRHFNESLFLDACDMYLDHFDHFEGLTGWKNQMFCIHIIGYIMRLFPACLAHAICSGLDTLEKGHFLRRSLALMDGSLFFPNDLSAHSGPGFDYMICGLQGGLPVKVLHARNGTPGIQPASVFKNQIKKFLDSKNSVIARFIKKYADCSNVDNPLSHYGTAQQRTFFDNRKSHRDRPTRDSYRTFLRHSGRHSDEDGRKHKKSPDPRKHRH